MAVVVIGGSGKDVGKTALVCAVIAALPEFGWTAVKITGHDYGTSCLQGVAHSVWEETNSGQETDTARYLAAGARRALLVARAGAEVPIEEIRRAVGKDRNVIFESNRIVDVVRPDVCVALMSAGGEKKPSFERLLRAADAVVSVGEEMERAPGVRWFQLASVEQLPGEMVEWMRERLSELR